MTCATCDQLKFEMSQPNKTISRRVVLGGMLDLHFRSRHPELLADLLGEQKGVGSEPQVGPGSPSSITSRSHLDPSKWLG